MQNKQDIPNNVNQRPDASEWAFKDNYIAYVLHCGESLDNLISFSDYVEQEMQHLSVPTELGKRIRMERKKLGTNGEQFSVECGINKNTLSAIESCKRPPNLNTLIRIADTLGMSLDTLIGRTVSTERRDKILAHQTMLGRKMHPEYFEQKIRPEIEKRRKAREMCENV